MKLFDVIGDATVFIAKIIARTSAAGFDLNDFVQMDHICYRTVSLENYTQKKKQLSAFAKLLNETNVNGRPIAAFRLEQPIVVGDWRVDTIELPAPKPGSDFKEGLEHAEFVLYDDIDSFLQKYKDKKFELRAADRGVNPEIGYNFDEYAVKFHLLSLPAVIYLEKKLGIDKVSD